MDNKTVQRKYCECGCGKECRNRFLQGHNVVFQKRGYRLCFCGCEGKSKKNYIDGHKPLNLPKLCECGCGTLVRRRFVSGHNGRGKPRISWNKGLTKKTHQSIANQALLLSKIWENPEKRKALSEKISGEKNPMFGTRGESSPSFGKPAWNKNLSRKEHPGLARTGEKSHERLLKSWQDPVYIERQRIGRSLRPNKAELKLLRLLTRINNSYCYVGDFQKCIGGKFPDFWNGDYKLVELFGDYWHKGENPDQRIGFFKQYGYKCLVVWESELKSEIILIDKLKKFEFAK